MSTTTAANKEYLKKLVQEVFRNSLNEQEFGKRWDPKQGWVPDVPEMSSASGYHRKSPIQPDPLHVAGTPAKAFGLSDFKDAALEKVEKVHEKKYKEILKSLTEEERWILKTNPDTGLSQGSKAERKTLSFVMSKEMREFIESLENKEINSNEDESVLNIQAAIGEYLEIVPDPDTLSDFYGQDKKSLEYAKAVWRSLNNKYVSSTVPAETLLQNPESMKPQSAPWTTNANTEFVKLLNLPSAYSSKSLERFYNTHLEDLNCPGRSDLGGCVGESIVVSYIAMTMSKDAAARSIIDNAIGVVGIATFFVAIASWKIMLLAWIVEYLILDVAFSSAFGGSRDIARVTVSKEEVLHDLKQLLTKLDSSDTPASEEEISEYFAALKVVESFMKEYIYEWINIIGKENMKLKVDSYLDAKPRTQRTFSKKRLREQIEVDINKVNMFFEGNEKMSSKTIETTLGRAVEIQLKQLGKNLSDMMIGWGAAHAKARAKGHFLQEGARVNVSSMEWEVDAKIAKVLEIGGRVADLSYSFQQIYKNLLDKKYASEKEVKYTARTRGERLWEETIDSYNERVRANTTANKHIVKLMKYGWALFTSMRLEHVTNKKMVLTVGLMHRKGGGFSPASCISSPMAVGTARADMIRGGALGKTSRGTVGPKFDENATKLENIGAAAWAKANNMADALEDMKTFHERGHIRDDFYEKRKEFMESYSDFYTKMSEVLDGFGSGKEVPLEIYKIFKAANVWNTEVKREK